MADDPTTPGGPIALTVHQPWATLILSYGKDVENRGWRPPVSLLGKRLLIHAGLKWDAAGWHAAVEMYGGQIPTYDPISYPAGVILGEVTVSGCHNSAACLRRAYPDLHPDGPFTCSRWAVGGAPTFHWTLTDPTPIEPVACSGSLRLWRPAAAVRDRIRYADHNAPYLAAAAAVGRPHPGEV